MINRIMLAVALVVAVPASAAKEEISDEQMFAVLIDSCAKMRYSWYHGDKGATERVFAAVTDPDMRVLLAGTCTAYSRGYNDGEREALKNTT